MIDAPQSEEDAVHYTGLPKRPGERQMIVLHGDLNEACLIAGEIFVPLVKRALLTILACTSQHQGRCRAHRSLELSPTQIRRKKEPRTLARLEAQKSERVSIFFRP
jgi:hypothetical protein